MTDVTGDQPAAGEELPAPGVDQTPEPEAPDDVAPEGDSQDGEGEEDLEDYEFEGKKLSIPKSARDILDKGVMRQADYTRKTQGLADDRRAYEAEKASNDALFEDKVKVREMQSQIAALDEAINQGHANFQNIDWAALKTLPDGDMRLQQAQIELRNLENARHRIAEQQTKLKGEMDDKTKASGLVQQQATAKLIEQREAALAKDIPGWTKLRPEVEAFAVKNGVTKAELDATPDPRILKMLYFAKLGQEAQQRGRSAAALEPDSAPVRPATTLTAPSSGKVSTSSKDSLRQSPEAWARARNAEIAARNQRGAKRR
jgi:hypothetical protein